MAVAPTPSSSFILGQVSPSIEPLQSNYFTKDLAKGKFTYKKPYLKDLLAKYDKDKAHVWKDIMMKGGSVQHLDFRWEEDVSRRLKRSHRWRWSNKQLTARSSSTKDVPT